MFQHIRRFLLPAAACVTFFASSTAAAELKPLTDADFHYSGRPDSAQVELGRLLFYDKLLSGNRNISCATCHHPVGTTGDGLPLSIGEGGGGFGVNRDAGSGASTVTMRIGRNAQPLFNLGAIEYRSLFHDGRVEIDPKNPDRFLTPVGDTLPAGLDNVLAAQAMFPLASVDEMAGQPGENEIAIAVSVNDTHAVWQQVERRIRDIPEYVKLMAAAYRHVQKAEDIRIVDIANAIAAFTVVEWRADNSRFDAYLRGDSGALTASERRGYQLFYGDAGCGDCHSGALQTDHDFHAVAMPQIGPGKGHGFDGHEDFGREVITGNAADRYRFRTPSLRNVAQTGPWGHSGAFDTLEAAVHHQLDPVAALQAYEQPVALTPSRPDLDGRDFLVQGDPLRRDAIASRNELKPVALDEQGFSDLVAFLGALTDELSIARDGNVPVAVPSGLPVDD